MFFYVYDHIITFGCSINLMFIWVAAVAPRKVKQDHWFQAHLGSLLVVGQQWDCIANS